MINLTLSPHSSTQPTSGVQQNSSASSSDNLPSLGTLPRRITNLANARFTNVAFTCNVEMPRKMAACLAEATTEGAIQFVSKTEKSINGIKESLQTTNAKLPEVVAKLKDKQDMVNKASKERAKFEINLEKAKEVVENIQRELDKLTKDLQDLKKGLAEAAKILGQINEISPIARTAMIDGLHQKIEKQENIINDQTTALEKAKIDLKAAQEQFNTSDFKQANETLQNAQQCYESCKEEYDRLVQQRQEIEKQLEQSQNFHKSCTAAAAQIKARMKEITNHTSPVSHSTPLLNLQAFSLTSSEALQSNAMEIDRSNSSSISSNQTTQPSSRAVEPSLSGQKRKVLATVAESTSGKKKQKVSEELTDKEIEIGEDFYKNFGKESDGELCELANKEQVFGPWMDRGNAPYALLRDRETQHLNVHRFFLVKVTGYPKQSEWFSCNKKGEKLAMKIFLSYENLGNSEDKLFKISRRLDFIPLPLDDQRREQELSKLKKSSLLSNGRVAYSLERIGEEGQNLSKAN